MRFWIATGKIGKHSLMSRVLANWKELETDSALEGRKKYYDHWLQDGTAYWDHNCALLWAADFFHAKSYLEIGVRRCGSLIHAILDESIEYIVGIDAWEGNKHAGEKSTYDHAQKIVDRYSNLKDIRLVQSYSEPALIKLVREGAKFDIVTVDGDHSKKGAANDLKYALQIATKCIIMDDIYHWSHLYLEQVVEEAAEANKLDYVINGQPPGTAIIFMQDILSLLNE